MPAFGIGEQGEDSFFVRIDVQEGQGYGVSRSWRGCGLSTFAAGDEQGTGG